MNPNKENHLNSGHCVIDIADDFDTTEVRGQLLSLRETCGLPAIAESDSVKQITLTHNSQPIDVMLKSFKACGRLTSWRYKHKGSRALRSWRAAKLLQQNGVPTPYPIACIERYENNCLSESYYLSEYIPLSNMRDELSYIYYHSKSWQATQQLLQKIAMVIRSMHDTGLLHGDLGNQNIMLERTTDDHYDHVMIIDLDRHLHVTNPSYQQRARDLQRLKLPKRLMQMFREYYFLGETVPQEFTDYADKYRKRFERHALTFKYRHPLRYLKDQRKPKTNVYPADEDITLLDSDTQEILTVLTLSEKS